MKYNKIFNTKYSNWNQLESAIEKLPTTYARGEAFEQFVYLYLSLNKNKYQLKEIYRSNNIPKNYLSKYKIEKKDSGVDGLIVFESGEVAGYQVKFRIGRKVPSYAELAKFWVESKNTDYNYVIANSYYVTKLAQKNSKHLSILVDSFLDLGADFFEHLYASVNEVVFKNTEKKLSPYPFQKRMIDDVISGFEKNDRGKLIAACGTGKTLSSMWISQGLNANRILFIAPSLALIKQTLEEWTQNYGSKLDYACVCSDTTVVGGDDDIGDILASDVGIPVTTNPKELVDFFEREVNDRDIKVVFSTYQSLDVVSEAQKIFEDFAFDLGIFDEAHRTAGSKFSNMFSLALNNENVNIKKRLFMTATERLIKPWIRKKAEESSKLLFSMDDEKNYGPVFHRFTFGDAIKEHVIADYKVVVAAVTKNEIFQLFDSNKIVELESNESQYHLSQNLLSQVILAKSFKELSIKKTISFHSNVKSAQQFINVGAEKSVFDKLLKLYEMSIPGESLYLDHVNGSMSAGQRKKILEDFKNSEFGIVTNARCLTEGVDVPVIDSVFFADPKSSIIDIVQACGRALRKVKGSPDQISYFIIPVIIDSENNESINYDKFEMVFNVIQAMRDQDSRLAEWIDQLNESVVRGKFNQINSDKNSRLSIILPTKVNLKDFADGLILKIADVNKDPTSFVAKTKLYGKKERKSNYKRIFRTLGDYSVESYKNSLVVPTIKLFSNPDQLIEVSKLKINHNNVSHTYRLGIINNDKKIATLTELGKYLWHEKLNFNEIFEKQMFRYYEEHKINGESFLIFPYRVTLETLLELKSINFYDFVFGLYSLSNEEKDFKYQAVERIKDLRRLYPNLDTLSISNRKKVLNELNHYFETNFSETDIWEKKTTINNQYIYFRNHLSILSKFLTISDSLIILNEDNASINDLKNELAKTSNIEKYDNIELMRQIYTSD